MAAIEAPTEEECYLYALMTDPSGIDLAELCWTDGSSESPDGCFRVRPYQYSWWHCQDLKQIDQMARSVGKTLGIKARMFSFPFRFADQEALVTAPELVHLEPITGLIEDQFFSCRLGREMVLQGRSNVTHRPFMMKFANGSRIVGRIPQRNGRGVKGQHPLVLELDEAQDYPRDGWTELNATLQMGRDGAQWRAHGVTRGVRDSFYEHTQDTPDNPWTVHRKTAQNHPNWNDEERENQISQYNNSRDDPDYRRNILGLHGDATNPIFVLRRLMKCVDEDLSSDYNTSEYCQIRISEEMLNERGEPRDIVDLLIFPHSHHQYKTTWCGMDVGFTSDPSEILIFGEYQPTVAERRAASDADSPRACPVEGLSRLKLLTRVTLLRISAPQQIRAILAIMDFYNPRAFSLDKTGNGLPLFQDLQAMFEQTDLSARARDAASRIKGYNFSAKVVVDIDETVEVEDSDDPLKDSAIHANVLEFSTDQLRTYVDKERMWLPWDAPLLKEMQGQTFSYSKAGIDAYGRRRRIFSEGSFHALDAARMAVMGHAQQAIEELLNKPKEQEPVFDQFVLA